MKNAKQDLNILQPLINFMNGAEKDLYSWFSMSFNSYGENSELCFAYRSQKKTFFGDGSESGLASQHVERIINSVPLEQVTKKVVADALVKANKLAEGAL